MDSFSIRDYVGKMRNVDEGAKSWPFGGREPRALPPMTVKKFRWWEDEAVAAVRPARDVAPSHGQEMKQTKSSVRAKQRAPKKRSIVELFAVAPPVEPIEDDGEAREDGRELVEEKKRDGSEEQNNGIGSAKAEPKLAKIIKQDKPLKDAKKKLRKKKGKIKAETTATKSEGLHKSKMSFPLNVSQLLQSPAQRKRCIRTTKSPTKTFKSPAIRKKKLVAKGLERQHKNVQNLKSIYKNRKYEANELPIRSILKSRTTGAVNKASGKGGLHGTSRNKINRDPKKHVSFSENDDVLGSNENSSLMGLPRLHRLCKIFSDVLAASSAMNNTTINKESSLAIQGPQPQCNSEKDVAIDVENITTPSSEKLHQCDGDKDSIISEKRTLLEPVDLNHDLQTYACFNVDRPDSSNLSPSSSYSHSQHLQVSKHNESLNPQVETLADDSCCSISGSLNLPCVVGNHASKSGIVSSAAITRSSSQQSASCSVISMGVSESVRQTNGYLSGTQPMGYAAPKYPLTTICSSVGSGEFGKSRIGVDPAKYAHSALPLGPNTVYRDECINENFVGLPLNSQGEFIKNASSKFGFSDIIRTNNPNLLPEPRSYMNQLKMKGKCVGDGMNVKDPLGQLPVQYPSSSRVVTYGSGCIQLHCCGTTQQGQDLRLQCEHVTTEAACCLCNEQKQSHLCLNTASEKNQFEGNLNGRFQSDFQPTMRLMGKNVTVGKSSSDCLTFDDGKIWTDKEIITDNKRPYEQLPEQGWVHHPAYGTSRGNMVQPFSTPNFLQSSFLAGRSNLMHFDLGPQVVSRDGHPLPYLNDGSLGIISHPRTEFVKLRHQAPVRNHPQDVYQHTMLGSTHCKHSQSISFNTISEAGLRPSFLNQGYLRFGDPCPANTSRTLPRWLMDATQQRPSQWSCCAPYSNPAALYRPCNISGTNISPCPLYPTSVISFPSYNVGASQACGSSGGSGVFPQFSLNNSSSVSGMYPARMKNCKGTKFSFMNSKVSPNTSRTRKRSSTKEDGFMKPAKKAALKIQHDLNAPTAQGGKQLEECKLNSGENDANMTETNRTSHQVVISEKDESRTTSSCASPKLDNVSKSGPFKLSAGTKHILKPCQAPDGENSRPVHSTEPFAFGNSSNSAPVSHKKAEKIYTF